MTVKVNANQQLTYRLTVLAELHIKVNIPQHFQIQFNNEDS